MLEEVGGALDQSRVHFLGRLPYSKFVGMLQLSSVHVYLTYPFVLSWSLIEAMSAGCLAVGSATAPVQEVIEDGVNGLLVDFFAPDRIVDAIHRVLDHRTRMQGLRDAARRTVVDRYDLATVCLPRQVELVERVAARIRPTDRLNPLPVSGAEPGR
jgi:glycosyltransferase involved in cell wall biosynthesis